MKKPLYNPLNTDFSAQYDIHGTSQPELFTIPSKTIQEFDEPLYSHMRKHLIDAVLDMIGKHNLSHDLRIQEAEKLIEVL